MVLLYLNALFHYLNPPRFALSGSHRAVLLECNCSNKTIPAKTLCTVYYLIFAPTQLTYMIWKLIMYKLRHDWHSLWYAKTETKNTKIENAWGTATFEKSHLTQQLPLAHCSQNRNSRMLICIKPSKNLHVCTPTFPMPVKLISINLSILCYKLICNQSIL